MYGHVIIARTAACRPCGLCERTLASSTVLPLPDNLKSQASGRPVQTYHATDVKGRKEVERTLIARGHGHVSDLTMPTRTALE